MHDPMTVAFNLGPLTVWHVDPEADGTDDSCGWSHPKLGPREKSLVKEMADWEEKFPYYFNRTAFVPDPQYPELRKISPGDAMALCINAFRVIAWRLDRKSLDPRLFMKAAWIGIDDVDNLQHVFVANSRQDREHLFWCLVRAYLRHTRPWWKHPRWHFWHWQLQFGPTQKLKRWLFSRCSKCGKGFSWGYSPVTSDWDGNGPAWFRGERNVFHHDCDRLNDFLPKEARDKP